MEAVREGHLEVVELLADGGAQLDLLGSDGRTALWLAAFENHPAVVRLLVGRGADQTIRGRDGRTPRELAVFHVHTECAVMLW